MDKSSDKYQCRLCLKNISDDFLYSLLDQEVVEILECFTPVKFDEDDDLPTISCAKCWNDVYLVCKIRSRIIESDRALREKYKSRDRKKCTQDTNKRSKSEEDDVSIPPANVDSVVIKKEDDQIDDDLEEQDADEHIEISISPDCTSDELSLNAEKFKFECSECKIHFDDNDTFLEHMLKHTNLTSCGVCGIQILSQNYRRHMEKHVSSPKVCELCGAVAKNAESLRGHMFYMHKSSPQQYECKDCGRFFRYRYKYKLHIRKQHEGGSRSHICELCAKTFFTNADVKRHIQMTHMKLRPYVCQYCNKGFSSSYARKTHVRQHTNEKPFKCEVCAEGFRQKVSLRTHLKSKHGMVNFPEQTVKSLDKLE